jgi:hypothetical protein
MTPNIVKEAKGFATTYGVTLADQQQHTLVQHLAAALFNTYKRGRAGDDVDFGKEAKGFAMSYGGDKLTDYQSRIFAQQLALALQYAYDRGRAPTRRRNHD